MHKFIFILSITCLCIACNSDQQKSPVNSTEVSQKSKTGSPSSEKERNMSLLQGKWRSIDDIGVFVIFEGNTRTEYRDDSKEKIKHFFEISDHCNNDTKGSSHSIRVDGKYISFQDIDMCYYIVSITPKELELSYVGRGNSLKYRKVKPLNQ